MNEACSSCKQKQMLPQVAISNKPGLQAISYRIGTYGSFLAAMRANISEFQLSIPSEEAGTNEKLNPLQNLTTRYTDDPSISLLDAWATVADVLTFYQERIANEGYLRTATERRSILELSRLLGYDLRPGVAASVYLAFTLEKGYDVTIPAGIRAQSLPKPGELPQTFETSEELAARSSWNNLQVRQTRPQLIEKTRIPRVLYFEGTATNLKPSDCLLLIFGDNPGNRILRYIEKVKPEVVENRTKVTLQDASTGPGAPSAVHVNESIIKAIKETLDKYLNLKDYGVEKREMAQRVLNFMSEFRRCLIPKILTTDFVKAYDSAYTKLQEERDVAFRENYHVLQGWIDQLLSDLAKAATESKIEPHGIVNLDLLLKPLSNSPFRMRPPKQKLLKPSEVFAHKSESISQLLMLMNPALKTTMQAALSNANVTPSPSLKGIMALRLKTAPFGANAPKDLKLTKGNGDVYTVSYKEWPLETEDKWTLNGDVPKTTITTESTANKAVNKQFESSMPILTLDGVYDKIVPGSWVAIKRSGMETPFIGQVLKIETVSRSSYGLTARVTRLTLDENCAWLTEKELTDPKTDLNLNAIRRTMVLAQSEELFLAEEPIGTLEQPEPVSGCQIELAELYDGLKPGRLLIVSGERADIAGTSGVQASELVMISGIMQDVWKRNGKELPGDKIHTFLELSTNLAYEYKRETLEIFGNVVNATHGQTRIQVLGSGDGNKPFQTFALTYSPLTYLAAATAKGIRSTLQVRVNDVLWNEVDSQNSSTPNDRCYIARTNDTGKTTVTFGDGKNGARLPSGVENVKAIYRTEIGKQGNVSAKRISLLATQPLGVKGVINPQPATGGADRESRDQARNNAPATVTALDRLVSVQDYADFTRNFAGITKATSSRLSDGHQQVIHVTIVGIDDIPIDYTSELYIHLLEALNRLGDPYQTIQVLRRELLVPIISAGIQILPEYEWSTVERKTRAKLLDDFGLEKRELGQDLTSSEIISSIQEVSGVAYVDIDVLCAISDRSSTKENGQTDIPTTEEIATKIEEMSGKLPPERIPVLSAFLENEAIRAAQIAYISPELPQAIILKEIVK